MILSRAIFREIDIVFADYLAELGADEIVVVTGAIVSNAISHGDICIDIKQLAETTFGESEDSKLNLKLYKYEMWKSALEKSKLVGLAKDHKLLILDGDRVYLHKYYTYQKECADEIFRLQNNSAKIDNISRSKESLEFIKTLFVDILTQKSSADEQLQIAAVLHPFFSNFSVISGGPGTGKTTVLTKILAAQLKDRSDLKIAMAAPTGKAAMRMKESIAGAIEKLQLPEDIKEKLVSQSALTIHRLLGYRKDSPFFRHNKSNPLKFDIVVVDEASMIDLAMMAKLLVAIKDGGQLILLGDMYQLASVEAGGVLADIREAFGFNRFTDSFLSQLNQITKFENSTSEKHLSPVIELKKSYRFDSNSGIGNVSRAINTGKINDAISLFRSSDDCKFTLFDEVSHDKLMRSIYKMYLPLLTAKNVKSAIARLSNYKLLCTMRTGRYGVEGVNHSITNLVLKNSKVKKNHDGYFNNMPIMITENSYSLGLFNGDTGIISENKNGDYRAWFIDSDTGKVESFLPAQLPSFEVAFAITVHKSQGSEFDEVKILLPQNESKVLTRELIYTGITRAKNRVEVVGTESILKSGLNKIVNRVSGLSGELIKNSMG